MTLARSTHWPLLVALVNCQRTDVIDPAIHETSGGITRESEPASSSTGFVCHYPPDRETATRHDAETIAWYLSSAMSSKGFSFRPCLEGDVEQMLPELVSEHPPASARPRDPWGRSWQAMCNQTWICVYSLGPDGVTATNDDLGACHAWVFVRPPYRQRPERVSPPSLTEFRNARAAP